MDLFGLMQQRLDWTQQRQATLAENVANANTPGYQPQDVMDFQSRLTHHEFALATTEAQHIAAPRADPLRLLTPRVSERSVDGNGVALESELTKVADNANAHQVASQLYSSYMGLFRTAIGKGS